MQNRKVDVIVIGGGVIGVSIAYYVATNGASVLLIEKGRIGGGCSHGNAGLIVPSRCHPLPTPGVVAQGLRYLMDPEGPFYIDFRYDKELIRWLWRFYRSCNEKHFYHSIGLLRKLSMESLSLHQELARAAGSQYEFEQTGVLNLYLSEKTFEENQEHAAGLKSYGVETTALSGDEVRQLEPAVGPEVVGGLLNKNDGRLEPAAFVAWLAQQGQMKGVHLLPDTEVFWLKPDHRRVTRVVTTQGDFEGDQVVLAAGAWVSQLTRHLGVRLPVQPAKGYSLTFHRPENAPCIPLLLEEARVAVTPFADMLRLAGTLELSGLNLDIDRRRLQSIQSQTYRYLPKLSAPEIREVWRGLRPAAPDGLPLLGRLRPYNNVLIAGGHGTKGMLLGPITGKYVSQLLAGESIGMPERSLKPQRF